MISFAPTEDQVSARAAMREVAAQVLRPLARPCDESSGIPESFFAQAWKLGLTVAQIPEMYGGFGTPRSPIINTLVLEELACGDAALALAALAPSSFAYAILDLGSEEQKRTHLQRVCGAEHCVATVAVIEPVPSFDVLRPRTRAQRRGHDIVLTGRKCFVPLGDRATHFLVVASADGGLEAFIVARDAPGLTISESEKNLGLKALSTVTLILDDVVVSVADRLGGSAGADVRRWLAHARVALSATLTGLARGVLEYCVPYAKERVAFDEPIARKQSIAFRLAEMHMEIESMRWLTWKAASQLEHGADATRSAHWARAYAADKAMWIADNGVQVFGGHGFIREHPVEMWYRNARTLGVLEGITCV